ncbi:ABC transporter permease [Corynebacterium sp. TAE3-ERU30]|uniref:ABC transporter permease n=1 Tax=Corynebacterium sp. TAE3-ERU30 TaxID=2849496 RepID=UPI001C4501E6|nr:ABC transporter permease [Corynebacterium sp. TAE3-ERU30]MBV7281373.1 ABC transporter permease [Corynebacterium sp. TAE3-ERU30]
MNSYSSFSTIGLVIRREAAKLLKSKSLWVMLGVMLAISVVGGVVGYINSDDEDTASDSPVVAVLGEDPSIPDRASAEEALRASDEEENAPRLDAVVVPAESGPELLYTGELPAGLLEQLNATRAEAFLESQGVDPAAMAATQLIPVQVSGGDAGFFGDPDTLGNRVVALVGVFLLVLAILMFAAMIGSAVMEEKTSRVIEIILATVRPLDFLWGKVLGIGLVAFGMVTVLFSAGIGAVWAAGLMDDLDFDIAIIPILVLFFILGFILFGLLYAAAGSLVSSMEDYQSAQLPVLLLALAMTYTPMFGFSKLDSTFMEIATWIPPFSVGLAPLQYAAGNISALQLAACALVLVLTTFAVSWLTSRIYRNSVLHSGSAISWLSAVKNLRSA